MVVQFVAGRTPPTLQAPAETKEFWEMWTRVTWPLCPFQLAWEALHAGCSPGSTFSRSWHGSPLFKGSITHFPPTLAADSGGDTSLSSGAAFHWQHRLVRCKCTWKCRLISPPSRRRWAVPMLCINKRFIRRVSVRRPAKFGTLIFHWGPEVWGVRGGGVGRIARGTLGAIPVMSWSNVRMETDGQRESGCRMLVSQDADETPSPYRGKPSTLKAPLAANQSCDHEHNTNTLLFPLMLASWLCCVCFFCDVYLWRWLLAELNDRPFV